MVKAEPTFRAPWSAGVWLITMVFCIVVLPAVVVAVVIICRQAGGAASEGLLFVIAGIPATIVLLCVLCAPLSYVVTEDAVIVRRVGPDVVIPVEMIGDVRTISRKDVGIGICLLGSSGFLGVFGVFYVARLGLVYTYVTDPGRLVLIECADARKYLLSPNAAGEFVRIVQTLLQSSRSDDDNSDDRAADND